MLVVIGVARARAGRREDLLAAARAVVEAARDDDGCRSYGFYTDIADDDTVLSLEVWEDQATLDAHLRHPHTAEFLARAPDLVEGPPAMAVHRVSRTDSA